MVSEMPSTWHNRVARWPNRTALTCTAAPKSDPVRSGVVRSGKPARCWWRAGGDGGAAGAQVLLSVCSLLDDPNPADPLVGSIAQQLTSDKAGHDKTAAEWTRRYAQG